MLLLIWRQIVGSTDEFFLLPLPAGTCALYLIVFQFFAQRSPVAVSRLRREACAAALLASLATIMGTFTSSMPYLLLAGAFGGVAVGAYLLLWSPDFAAVGTRAALLHGMLSLGIAFVIVFICVLFSNEWLTGFVLLVAPSFASIAETASDPSKHSSDGTPEGHIARIEPLFYLDSTAALVKSIVVMGMFALLFGFIWGAGIYIDDPTWTDALMRDMAYTAVAVTLIMIVGMSIRKKQFMSMLWYVVPIVLVAIYLTNIIASDEIRPYVRGVNYFMWLFISLCLYAIISNLAWSRSDTRSTGRLFVARSLAIVMGTFAVGLTIGRAFMVALAYSSDGVNMIYISVVVTTILLVSITFIPAMSPFRDKNAALEPHEVVDADPIAARCRLLSDRYGLSAREQEVLVLLAHGRTRAYIAEELYISENTSRGHIKNIYTKAKVHSRQELLDLLESQTKFAD
jgi:DNA-binding CsgD family transcriptional regulator